MLASKINAYKAVESTKIIDYTSLVKDNQSLVRRIAFHLKSKLTDNVSVDDLIQDGNIGLMEAARNFDNNNTASFETFAGIRIRGAMIDSLRKSDWTPRSVSKNNREINSVRKTLSNKLNREPMNAEIAIEMGLSITELSKIQQDIASTRMVETDDLALTENISGKRNSNTPEQSDEKERFQKYLLSAIKQLTDKDGLVISLYYQEELNLKEIGAILDVTEGRSSQLLKAAIINLRKKMKDWID
jgi:RNA polymerase sigma factor for flagellar operon FliA